MIAKYVIVNGKERPPYQMIVYVEKMRRHHLHIR